MGDGRWKLPRRRLGPAVLLAAAWLTATGIYQSRKPLPGGIGYRGPVRTVPAGDITFLSDLTYRAEGGGEVREQEIFDAVFDAVGGARRYVLADFFLFNPFGAEGSPSRRGLSEELTALLERRRRLEPSLAVDFVTDPINVVYGGDRWEGLERLRAAGVNVVLTDLSPLRDSNPLYSSLWRTFLQWFGNSAGGGLFPHPFSPQREGVTLRSWLEMINFKANHRKAVAVDSGDGHLTIVTSANPHDASSAHSNVAFAVRGELWRDLRAAEEAVARLSGSALSPLPDSSAAPASPSPGEGPAAEVVLVSEGRVKEEFLEAIGSCGGGDDLWLAMFYLSDRDVVDGLVAAAERGARVRILLDPNRDAFGFEKNGVPNRPAARELVERTGGRIEVRWYETRGEQFHSKLLFADRGNGKATAILGSSNLTRRNLDDYNLELDVRVDSPGAAPPMADVREWLERIWTNRDGKFTVEYGAFADGSPWKALLYRAQEFSGLCSF